MADLAKTSSYKTISAGEHAARFVLNQLNALSDSIGVCAPHPPRPWSLSCILAMLTPWVWRMS
jgi:hypothetical protein